MIDNAQVRDDGGRLGFPHIMQFKQCSENKPESSTPPGFSPPGRTIKDAETTPRTPAETEVAASASQRCDEF